MIIFLLFITEIILFIINFLVTKKDIMRPSIIMIVVFLFSTFIAILNYNNWHINYSFKAYSIISVNLLIAVLVDICFYNLYSKNKVIKEKKLRKLDVNKIIYLVIVLIEILTLFLYFKEIKRLAYLDGYRSGMNLLWHFRNITSYTAEESINGFVNLLLKLIDASAYVFSYILINNLLIKKVSKKDLILYSIPIAIFCIKVLMGSGRLDLLRLASYVLVISYIINKNKKGWNSNISFTYIKKALILIPFALFLFYSATSIIGRETSRTLFQYISTYAGGSIQHFNQYIQEPYIYSNHHFGEETFPGVYSALKKIGLTDYTRPVHLEMRKLGVTQGNIYTFFRRPYSDFGMIGVILMTFIVICFFSKKYSCFATQKESFKNDISIINYGYLFYWIVLSSIEQYSIGIVSIGTIITIIYIYIIYFLITRTRLEKNVIIIKK